MLLARWLGLALLALSLLSWPRVALSAEAKREGLRVNANHHYLERGDGTPFFYLGDTAWMLCQRLAREDVDRYLQDRARKGFTVIQLVALFSLEKNAYGEAPLLERNPARPNEAYFQHVDYLRQAAYWSLLGGACGHTYGNNNVWQFHAGERTGEISANQSWAESLDHPGAFQMRFVRRLFESRPYQKLEPRQSMIVDGPAEAGAKVRAARATDGSFAFIYSPRGAPFTIDQSIITGPRLKKLWYDPRYGIAYWLHTGTTKAMQTYTPPTAGRGCDWMLIVEDESRRFPALGATAPD